MTKWLKIIAVIMMAVILPAVLIGMSNIGFRDPNSAPAMAESSLASPTPESAYSQTPAPIPTPDPAVLALSGENYGKGLQLLFLESYDQARACFLSVIPEDVEHYALAQDKLIACRREIKSASLDKGRASFDKAHYTECRNIADQALLSVPDDPELKDLSDKAQEALDNPVPYDGPIYHIFFHSLIVYPELCFTGDAMSQGYNKWMTTVTEFKAILSQLYDRSYVLIDIEDLFSYDQSGKMVRNDLYLPEGEKPLILSIDNVSYEDYRVNDGFARRLVLDGSGNVATLVKTPQGDEIVTRDGDAMPILDDFIKECPDFSMDNAKGIIALDGYTGILGYRTNRTNPDWEQEKEKALRVVDRLKETGWKFACHSYSHTRKFSDKSISLESLKNDTDKWEKEVADITGPTPIYVTPFGIEFAPDDSRLQYLVSEGYTIFCNVGYRAYYDLRSNYVFMERIDIDGYKMNYSRKALEPLIDIDTVYDPARPPMEK